MGACFVASGAIHNICPRLQAHMHLAHSHKRTSHIRPGERVRPLQNLFGIFQTPFPTPLRLFTPGSGFPGMRFESAQNRKSSWYRTGTASGFLSTPGRGLDWICRARPNQCSNTGKARCGPCPVTYFSGMASLPGFSASALLRGLDLPGTTKPVFQYRKSAMWPLPHHVFFGNSFTTRLFSQRLAQEEQIQQGGTHAWL